MSIHSHCCSWPSCYPVSIACNCMLCSINCLQGRPELIIQLRDRTQRHSVRARRGAWPGWETSTLSMSHKRCPQYNGTKAQCDDTALRVPGLFLAAMSWHQTEAEAQAEAMCAYIGSSYMRTAALCVASSSFQVCACVCMCVCMCVVSGSRLVLDC